MEQGAWVAKTTVLKRPMRHWLEFFLVIPVVITVVNNVCKKSFRCTWWNVTGGQNLHDVERHKSDCIAEYWEYHCGKCAAVADPVAVCTFNHKLGHVDSPRPLFTDILSHITKVSREWIRPHLILQCQYDTSSWWACLSSVLQVVCKYKEFEI